jgi:putative ABC transport system permease protein
MKVLATIRSFASAVIGRSRFERDMEAELRAHLDARVDDLIAHGASPADAQRRAREEFGDLLRWKEQGREARGLRLLDELRADVTYALRWLRRSPGFAAAAILSLALGIGANTAIFSVIDSLMLRTLPVRQPDRLVQFLPGNGHTTWTYPMWAAIRANGNRFGGVLAWSSDRFDLSSGGAVEPANGLRVSGRFFDVLGLRPTLGRGFTPDDDARGGGREGSVAVISYAFWQRHFGGAVEAIGRTLSINRVPFTIVGVTPRDFTGPDIGVSYDVAVPLGTSPLLDGRDRLDERTHWWLRVMARLAPGQTVAGAASALAGLQPAFRAATMPQNMRPQDQAHYLEKPFQVVAAPDGPSNVRLYYRQPLIALMIVVGLVLLVACANIANLLLARADARRHEVSVRLALGASRWRVMRQFLVENLLLSAGGAAVGGFLAAWGSRLLIAQFGIPSDPMFLDLALDWRVLGFTAAVTVLVAFVFGTAPAFRATRVDAHQVLKERSRGVAGDGGRGLATLIVPTEVALCVVLVAGAGLFVRTFLSLAHRDLGFDATRVLVVGIDARKSAKPPAARFADYDRLIASVRALPGVAQASLSALTPLSGSDWDTLIENPVGVSLAENERSVYENLVTPDWFATYGMALVAGRDLDWHDVTPTPAVVVINETAARRYFPGKNPIGQMIREVGDPKDPAPPMTIVGVVRDATYDSLRDAPPPTLYEPIAPNPQISLSVRAGGIDPSGLTRSVVAAIEHVDAGLALTIRPLTQDLDDLLLRERLLARLSAFFGVLALALAGLGIYGVVAYAVSRRQREIGIRTALGASSGRVVRVVVRQAAVLVAIGVVAGLVLSVWASRFAATLLYGLAPGDPVTLGSAAATLVAVALLASWLPSRRAARIDPARVLREG